MSRSLPLLPLLAFCTVSPLSSQSGKDPGVPVPKPRVLQTGGPDESQTRPKPVTSPKERIARLLKNLAATERISGKLERHAKFPFQVAVGGKAPKIPPDVTTFLQEGPLCVWSRHEGEGVLARLGGRWVRKDRDGAWIPSLGPTGPRFERAFLPDLRFLARRLLENLDAGRWTFEGGDTIEDRPVRVYHGRFPGKASRPFLRTGALPPPSLTPGLNIVFMGIGGMKNALPPEPRTDLDFVLFEDPARKLPLRIRVEYRTKGNANPFGAMVRVVRAGGGKDKKEEEEKEEENEEEEEDRPKPSMTLDFHLDFGKEAPGVQLPEEARKFLR